ncbi:polyamine aminopropyltransferase [Sporomusa acidovorans]|uniref:Polyamine aminopropyltransferase n=1 Tax=Sporomusa acidovorans (strain ATCC 49682 / DSM 3132 / Mol) TaxID=1123286 RepID=A0ABZ3J0U0_SPOA4|nr:polyamine aminopropyltransferase [Sporomusa acidovorans]OZC24223.1 spermidine synthase [Sporomusa acidovorans DSM 3132]SDF55855.1 spermidine synthase [Sporomusa acidovorans]
MELWYTEYQTKNLGLAVRIKKTLYSGHSEFQEIAVVDSYEFGRMLILDGVFQTSIFDEFIYHEMIAHVPLFVHPNPRNVLVIGGGDGGTIREVVKHHTVEVAEMVEIDGQVVEASKKYLPEISSALNEHHPKLRLKIGDGIKHMQEVENKYDVIIVDCSDPIGPGEGLFTRSFYENVHKALKPDGLFVQQTESPFYHQELIRRLTRDISSLFPITRLYLASIPLYPGGLHCFTIGSKQYDPAKADIARIPENINTRYYNREIQKNCFALPSFIQKLVK